MQEAVIVLQTAEHDSAGSVMHRENCSICLGHAEQSWLYEGVSTDKLLL
jgi:hypothetical protein